MDDRRPVPAPPGCARSAGSSRRSAAFRCCRASGRRPIARAGRSPARPRRDGGRRVGDAAGAEAMDEGQAAGLVAAGRGSRPARAGSRRSLAGPILTPIGLAMPRKYSTWAPRGSRGAHADPREVGGEVVPAGAVRDAPRLRLLVEQVQALVAGEEIHPAHLGERLAGERLHEAQGLGDGAHPVLVLGGVRGELDEGKVPVLGVMQVGEAALDQRADEVDGQRRRARSRAASSSGSGVRSSSVNGGRLIRSPR